MPTAIEFFKMLPKTNCGDCGFPTCLAFAMQLANQKTKLDDCPHVSDDAKTAMAESSAPPIRRVTIGKERTVEMGDETVLYRHERRFDHPTAYAMIINDTMTDTEIENKLARFGELSFERIGETISMDLVAVRCDSGDGARFATVTGQAAALGMPLMLMVRDPDCMSAALSVVPDQRPLVHGLDRPLGMAGLAKAHGAPMALRSNTLDGLVELVENARAAGIEDLVLDLDVSTSRELLEMGTILRRNAIKRSFRGLGHPFMVCVPDDDHGTTMALVATMKYGSLVAFEDIGPEKALPLFVLRQNIYTDPQVPIQVKEGLYPINDPDNSSPILFTTNFSLTYFTVASDIERSRVPVWLQVVDTEGLSVLTAYSAGKLTVDHVIKAMDASKAKENGSDMLIIPGMVARMSGKLQEASGMRVIVGPRESSGLPRMLKDL